MKYEHDMPHFKMDVIGFSGLSVIGTASLTFPEYDIMFLSCVHGSAIYWAAINPRFVYSIRLIGHFAHRLSKTRNKLFISCISSFC